MSFTRLNIVPRRDSIPIYTSESQFSEFIELSCRSNSKVFSAICTATGMHVAIKRFQKRALSAKEAVHVAREVHLMGILRTDPGVIHILGFFEDELHAYIVMEYCAGRDLYKSVVAEHRLDEHFAACSVITPLLATLNRLHNTHHILHRDIKPENVLLTASGEIRLADFGTAIQCDVEVPFLAVGTLDFMAPEVLFSFAPKGAVESPCTTPEMLAEAGLKPYDYKADVWSVGALAYELVVGEPPFYHEEAEETKNMILGSSFLYFPTRLQNTQFQRFVSAAMTRDPAARPSANTLLQHEWLGEHAKQEQDRLDELKNNLNGNLHTPLPPVIAIFVDATGNGQQCSTPDGPPPPPLLTVGSTKKSTGKPRLSGYKHRYEEEDTTLEGSSAADQVGKDDELLQRPHKVNRLFSSSSSASHSGEESSSEGNGASKNTGQLRRIRSALTPQGSWLKKFSIRRNHEEASDAAVVVHLDSAGSTLMEMSDDV